MNKETLSAYLPYDVKAKMLDHKIDYVGKETDTITGLYHLETKSNEKLWHCNTKGGSKPSLNRIKLILRPLNTITKKDIDYLYFEIISTDNDAYGTREEFENFISETHPIHLPVCVFNYLVKHHFDVFGLIEKEQAITK